MFFPFRLQELQVVVEDFFPVPLQLVHVTDLFEVLALGCVGHFGSIPGSTDPQTEQTVLVVDPFPEQEVQVVYVILLP